MDPWSRGATIHASSSLREVLLSWVPSRAAPSISSLFPSDSKLVCFGRPRWLLCPAYNPLSIFFSLREDHDVAPRSHWVEQQHWEGVKVWAWKRGGGPEQLAVSLRCTLPQDPQGQTAPVVGEALL